LSKSKILTVIGYSFGDDHLNTYISQWLNFNQENYIRIIDPNFNESRSPYVSSLKILRDKRPSQVVVMQEKASYGLERLYGEEALGFS